MNERIKELAYQAEDYADGIVDQGGEFHQAYTQKFAELIVKECVLQIADVRIENDFEPVGDAVLVRVLMGFKEHFGVE